MLDVDFQSALSAVFLVYIDPTIKVRDVVEDEARSN